MILLPGVEEPDAQKALFWGDASLTKETGKSVFDPISLVTLPPAIGNIEKPITWMGKLGSGYDNR